MQSKKTKKKRSMPLATPQKNVNIHLLRNQKITTIDLTFGIEEIHVRTQTIVLSSTVSMFVCVNSHRLVQAIVDEGKRNSRTRATCWFPKLNDQLGGSPNSAQRIEDKKRTQ